MVRSCDIPSRKSLEKDGTRKLTIGSSELNVHVSHTAQNRVENSFDLATHNRLKK